MKISLSSRKDNIHPEKPEKVYARTQHTKLMSYNEFAQYVAAHDNKYKRGDIYAVTDLITTHLIECLLKGYKVELGTFGSFQANVVSAGAESAEAFTIDHIKGIKIIWDRPKEWADLKEKAEFDIVPTLSQQAQIRRLVRKGGLSEALEGDGGSTAAEGNES